MIRVLRTVDRIATPWKNGGGITREIVAWPPGAGFDDFDWRVGTAEVREPGPFSRFDHIDRTLIILEGRLELTFADRAIELTPASEPFVFPGDVACDSGPIGGVVTDLNIMVRRGRATASVQRVSDAAVPGDAPHTVVVAVSACTVRVAGEVTSLATHDALHIEGKYRPIDIAGTGYVIGFM